MKRVDVVPAAKRQRLSAVCPNPSAPTMNRNSEYACAQSSSIVRKTSCSGQDLEKLLAGCDLQVALGFMRMR
eukprot:2668662-Amphidinium_carterae.1